MNSTAKTKYSIVYDCCTGRTQAEIIRETGLSKTTVRKELGKLVKDRFVVCVADGEPDVKFKKNTYKTSVAPYALRVRGVLPRKPKKSPTT